MLESALLAKTQYPGKCNVFVNDDGLLLVSDEEKNKRMAYYILNGLDYIARPVDNRPGRFKKASNMNYCLRCATNQAISGVNVTGSSAIISGPIEIGEYILLLDGDSRVPEACLQTLVWEMLLSPKVAYLQCQSQGFAIEDNYLTGAFLHLTSLVNNVALPLTASGGDTGALIGHNVLLRWSALEEVMKLDGNYWSEDNVSEDFYLSLRLQVLGYCGRFVTYTGDDFKEGVSLSVIDEVRRFSRYAYGSSEILFNPVWTWWYQGPFGSLFVQYLFCYSVPWQSKVNLLGYLGSYFALATVPSGSLIIFFLDAYVDVWESNTVKSADLVLTVYLIFAVFGPLISTILNYRLKRGSLWDLFWIEVKWSIILSLFFLGIPWSLMTAILGHLLGLNLSWGATSKSQIGQESRLKVLLSIVKTFYPQIIYSILMFFIVSIFWYLPEPYQIQNLYFAIPLLLCSLGHLVSPFLLTPGLW
jgi:hypothetical protein